MANDYKTTYRQKGVMVILPFPLSDIRRRLGSVEKLTLGSKRLEVIIPPNVRVGQKVRLKGIAHYIDPQLHGEDLYLLIETPKLIAYEFTRDIHLELPLHESLFFNNYAKQDKWEILMIENKKLEVKIPTGFQIGKKIRLAGMAKYGNGGYAGDVYLSPTIINRSIPIRRAFFDSFAKSDETKISVKSTPTRRTFFDSFGKPDETKISIKFVIPFLEISMERVYKKSEAEMTASNMR